MDDENAKKEEELNNSDFSQSNTQSVNFQKPPLNGIQIINFDFNLEHNESNEKLNNSGFPQLVNNNLLGTTGLNAETLQGFYTQPTNTIQPTFFKHEIGSQIIPNSNVPFNNFNEGNLLLNKLDEILGHLKL